MEETREDDYWTVHASIPVCVVVLTFQVLGMTHEFVSRFWFAVIG
jgi:hypothetical protein